MRLDRFEFLAMNNPIRRFVQKHLEFGLFKQHLRKHRIDLAGKVILDIGCGSGYSSELIFKEFMPSRMVALDFMPEQINLAKRRALKADFFMRNVTRIELPSSTFDAIFIFGVLHHVIEWKRALHEVARVLKPEGVLLMEEPDKAVIDWFEFFLRFKHPEEAKFNYSTFAAP